MILAAIVMFSIFACFGSRDLIGGAALAQARSTTSDDDIAKTIAALEAVQKRAASADYERARWDPIHFKPAIDSAKNEACLVCHQEIITAKPRTVSPAGVKAADTLAWYQTLDTYSGPQATFHWRHLQSPFAKQVMNLSCNFCHQGNDPREEAPSASATGPKGGFTLRKVVDTSKTCLLCHGSFPAEMMGFEKDQKWHEMRGDLETAEAPNGCLTCHAEQFRTVRHQVNYLRPNAIEALAKKGSSDSCYGCHGGRQWYRISYPYPRHPWPNMPDEAPDWAKDRPAESEARFKLPVK